jgi:two-component system alkaline phosphatase synthesis response regulator PhoP
MYSKDLAPLVSVSANEVKKMSQAHILVVDDEPDLLELVQYNLIRSGYQVTCVTSGEEALARIRSNMPDLIVLDLMLPGIDGLDLCKMLKQEPQTAALPVVMLTARTEDADVVTGLEIGADDYLTKPFSPRVLVARIKAVLRRQREEKPPDMSIVVHDDIRIHPGRHEVRVGGRLVRLTPTEFRILHLLAQRPGWVFTRYQIVDRARGDDAGVTERSVDVHIAALRRKLGQYGEVVETIRGVGYRMGV